MKKLYFFITIVFAQFHSYSQNFECGTILRDQDHQLILKLLSSEKSNPFEIQSDVSSLIKVAISAHILRKADGTGGLSLDQLNQAITSVNEFYANAGMEFFLFGDVNFIDNDTFYDFDASQENALANDQDVANTINVYFVNSLISGSNLLCGYTYFPGSPDRILMDNSCTITGNTLSHEIGHFFTLYHTHGRTNNGTTDELVNGSNCETAGDNLCDTAADPNLSGKVDANCAYTLNERDSNGDIYRPDPANIMSYSTRTCRRLFSNRQYARILTGYQNARNYLYEKEYVANFRPLSNIACRNDEVQFEDLSLGKYNRILWEFEGGNPSESEELDPKVIFTEPGTFDAKLTVYGADGGIDSKVISNAILILEHEPVDNIELIENFESPQFANYSLFSPDDEIGFDIHMTNVDSAAGILFHDYEEIGNQDFLLLEPLENPGVNDYILSFDYAFTYRLENNREIIDKVDVISNECGPWKKVYSLNGKLNATAEPTSAAFYPTNDDWKNIEVYIPVSEDAEFVQLAVNANNKNGNNFFLDNIQINYANEIVIRSLKVTDEVCLGDGKGIINVDASFNGQSISYQLDDNPMVSSGVFTNVSSGQHRVTIFAVNSSKELEVEIGSLSQPPPKPLLVLAEGQLKMITNAPQIEWYYNDQLIEDSGINFIDLLGTGSYYVVVRNQSGCEATSDVFIVLGSEFNTDRLVISPNPATDGFKIISDKSSKNNKIEIFDLSGIAVLKLENYKGETIGISDFSPGIYLVVIKENEEIKTLRLVKE